MSSITQKSPKQVLVTVQMDDAHAQALAQFLKRVGWSEMRACAETEAETYSIRESLDQIARELADVGYSPR